MKFDSLKLNSEVPYLCVMQFELEFRQKALEALYTVIEKQSGSVETSIEEGCIDVDGKLIEVAVDFEEHEIVEDHNFVTILFTTKLADQQRFVFQVQTLGIGPSFEEALQVAVQEWLMSFGYSFSSLLFKQNGLEFDEFTMYPGLLGIRGSRPSIGLLHNPEEMALRIGNVLQTVLGRSKNDRIVSLDIKAMLTGLGLSSGDCLLNNEVSLEVFQLLQSIDFGQPDSECMIKQYYLIEWI